MPDHNGLQFGVGLREAATASRDAQLAEQCGFDSVFCGEHVLFRSPTSNPFVALSAAAAVSRTLRLLTAVTLAPLYPPVLLAKLAVTLDQVSGGRLDLGVGAGGDYPEEFAAIGADPQRRGELTDAALAALTSLFAGEPARDAVTGAPLSRGLDPPPVQPGGPPLWIAGRSGAARRRAGRCGSWWMPYVVTPDQLRSGMADVRDAAQRAGRASDDVSAAVHVFVLVDTDGAVAERRAAQWTRRTYGEVADKMRRYLVAGTPAQCAARLTDYHRAGARSLQLSLACSPSETEESMRLLGRDVLPVLRERLTGQDAAGEGAH